MSISYDDLETYLDWVKVKADLNFSDKEREDFPIYYNCIYWAYMGSNVGSEEGKHRPVLVTRTYKDSPICVVLPLTSKRLNDDKPYHVDLKKHDSTVLCEQMRIIDTKRIDKPMLKNGRIATIINDDWKLIDFQVRKQYSLSKLPEQKGKK